MKRFYMLSVLLIVLACKETEPGDNPLISKVTFSASSYRPGEEIVMSISARGDEVPLSTVFVRSVLDEIYLVDESRLRTPGMECTVEYRLSVPLVSYMDDTHMTFEMEIESVHGVRNEYEARVEIKKPVFPRLYLVMPDGSLKIMEAVKENEGVYCATVNIPKNVALRVVNRLDMGGFNWYWNDVDMVVGLGDGQTPIALNNDSAGTYHVFFDTYTFELYAERSI